MKKIILAIAVAAVASMAVASFASAGVARYQVATGLTVSALGGTYIHTYNLNTSCDGTFTGTGGINSLGLNESISGKLNGSANIVIDSTYLSYNVPFNYHYSGPLTGGGTYTDSLSQAVPVTFTVTMSNYKSHSDYLSQGGSSDAAHSCIGTPKTGLADGVLGSIVYDNGSFGLANFSFAGQDGGNGTAFYADKSGYYFAKATNVAVTGPTTATMSLQVTSSTHPAVPVGTTFTVTLHDEPGAPDYFTINLDPTNTHLVAKVGNIVVNYR